MCVVYTVIWECTEDLVFSRCSRYQPACMQEVYNEQDLLIDRMYVFHKKYVM